MVESAKVVIIGGGIVGCSVLYALAKRGWNDILLVERTELTSGSTWHAAGNVTHFGHFAELAKLHVDSLSLYKKASEESGREIGFHRTGSLRLATNKAEMYAYRSLIEMYDSLDTRYEIASPEVVSELHPLLKMDGLLGAAYTPDDGHLDPYATTHALAESAQAAGARVWTNCDATRILPNRSGKWTVETPTARVLAEHVVLAASYWSRSLAKRVGIDLPLYAIEHQEIITDAISDLIEIPFEVPTIRDPRAPSNVRQEGHSFLCGVYESEPAFRSIEEIPMDFESGLFEPDLDRLLPNLQRVADRIPSFGTAGIKRVVNGPLCFTPDGCPLVGSVSSHKNLWLAAGFPVGIGTGGGAGVYLAELMAEGRPVAVIEAIDPERFPGALTVGQCLKMIRESYSQGYVLPRRWRRP